MPEERFEAFLQEYGDRAYQFAYKLCGNPDEAKDLVQEAFFHLLRRREDYDASQGMEGWFFTTLKHVFLDARKRFERRNFVSLDEKVECAEDDATYADLLPDEERAALDRLESEESASIVREALQAMSGEHRVILTLCDMQGMSYEEIAKVLDVPPGTVRSRISRARIALRRRLARKMRVDP
ncbi:MAG: RNA polymerase sigma factor [Elusimicrobiota bacterium]